MNNLKNRAWSAYVQVFLNNPYVQLMRLNKPIGILLLLWPTLSALWLAAKGMPSFSILMVFVFGVLLMRSAGCVINDWADRKFDGRVNRTQNRPLATGAIPHKHAIYLFIALSSFAFSLVLFLNPQTIWLSFGGVLLAAIYPFMKRVTYYPQVVLGAAFSWGIVMAFSAVNQVVSAEAWLLFLANVLWTLIYDTQYAMVDRDDDLKIGIKSTAILFGDGDKFIIGLLQVLVVFAFAFLGNKAQLSAIFYVGLLGIAVLFYYQQRLMKRRKPEQCFQAFLNNNWVGLILFVSIVIAQAVN